jgi:hypothetical protein
VSHDAFGNVTSMDGPLAGSADTTAMRYDALQRPVATVSPDPDGAGPLLHRAQITSYDADGNVASVQSGTATSLTGTITPLTGQGWLKLAYDGFGRPTEQRLVTGAEGSITTHAFVQTSYDAKGRVDCQAQRMNPSTFETPPPSACTLALEGTFGPDGSPAISTTLPTG